MALLTVAELSLAFGRKLLFQDASFHLGAGEKVALVGPNGSGKTSLFRILAGQQEPDDGEVHLGKSVHLAYLPQDIAELPPGSLVESVRSAVPGREALEREERELHEELASAEDDEARTELAGRLAELHEHLAGFEARYGAHRAEELLSGLGFQEADFSRPIAHFSGGWKMRAALAGLLLVDPDVLLLDEPTNHLDVPSQAWLDGFLDRSRAAVLFVSHDRGFVNRHAQRVLAIEPEGVRSYPGGFDDYKRLRAEEAVNLQLKAERLAKQRAELQRFIDRFRAKATKARQAQSRVKMLAKMETVQVHEERATVAFRFPPSERSGKEVLRIEHLQKRFGEKVVWKEASATVQRGDRIAIVGANGAGKTTLLKMVAGELPPDTGAVTIGHNVRPAYFAQHHTEKLDPGKTVLAEISQLAPTQPQSWVRGILGSFLFSGDEVDKKIAVLSGGERARVSLASLLVVPSNLLLMDEPTNHLDLDSVERLTEALVGYDGTLVFVSHDRGFVDTLATKVWDVRDGVLHEWPGNLTSWIEHLAAEGVPWAGAAAPKGAKKAAQESDKERRQREAKEREERRRTLGPLQKQVTALEASIAAAEAEQAEIDAALAAPDTYADRERAEKLGRRRGELLRTLEQAYASWEALGAELEAAKAALAG